MDQFRIFSEGPNVFLVKNGQLIAGMPWEASEQLWRGIRSHTKRAERYAKNDEIVRDGNILRASGAPGNIVGGFLGEPRLIQSKESRNG